jgi:hypothetical protein
LRCDQRRTTRAAFNAALGTAVAVNMGSAMQAGNVAGGSTTGSRNRSAAVGETSATVLSRLFAPEGAPALLKLLLPSLIERNVNDSQSPSLAGMLAQLRPRMARMSANDVRGALEHSGLFTEARLLQTDNGLRADQRTDLKQLLNQLERALASDSSSAALTRAASEEMWWTCTPTTMIWVKSGCAAQFPRVQTKRQPVST